MKIEEKDLANKTEIEQEKKQGYTFKNITFDKNEKTFTIVEGTKGTFSYIDIVQCKIVNEDAKYTGNTELFTHKVLADYFQPWGIFPKNVYVGLEFIMKNEDKIYAYITGVKRQINTLDYHDDRRKAKEVKEIVDRIINKYKER